MHFTITSGLAGMEIHGLRKLNPSGQEVTNAGKMFQQEKTMFLKHEATFREKIKRLQIHVFENHYFCNDKFNHVSKDFVFSFDNGKFIRE